MTMKKLWFEDEKIFIQTGDGKVLWQSFLWYPRLKNATEEERNAYLIVWEFDGKASMKTYLSRVLPMTSPNLRELVVCFWLIRSWMLRPSPVTWEWNRVYWHSILTGLKNLLRKGRNWFWMKSGKLVWNCQMLRYKIAIAWPGWWVVPVVLLIMLFIGNWCWALVITLALSGLFFLDKYFYIALKIWFLLFFCLNHRHTYLKYYIHLVF